MKRTMTERDLILLAEQLKELSLPDNVFHTVIIDPIQFEKIILTSKNKKDLINTEEMFYYINNVKLYLICSNKHLHMLES
jgi:hypothetical protein